MTFWGRAQSYPAWPGSARTICGAAEARGRVEGYLDGWEGFGALLGPFQRVWEGIHSWVAWRPGLYLC